jgi:hypothetical protein
MHLAPTPHHRATAVTRRGLLLVALLGAGILGSSGCSATAGDPVGAEQGKRRAALAGASVDGSNTGVLALVVVKTEQIELCTATLVTPNLVLTARHCVADTSADVLQCSGSPVFFSEPYDLSSLWVNRTGALSGPLSSFGLLALTGGSDEFLPVAAVRVPETAEVCGGDVAALILDGQLDMDQARPLAPRLDEPVVTGEGYAAVGFGSTKDGSGQGVRRSRADLATSCGDEDCLARTNLAPNEFAGGEGVCSGDSGGPAIDSDGRVIGIASRSVDCTGAVYSAVSSWRDFIRGVTEEAVRLGEYPAPDWLIEAPQPEPEPEPPAAPPEGDQPAALDAGMPDVPTSDDPPSDGEEDAASPPVAAGDGGDSSCQLGAAPAPPSAAAGLLVLALVALARRGLARRTVGRGIPATHTPPSLSWVELECPMPSRASSVA